MRNGALYIHIFHIIHTEMSSPMITTGESALYTKTGRLNAIDMARNSIWPPHSTIVLTMETYHWNSPPLNKNHQSQHHLRGNNKIRPCADACSWQLFDGLHGMHSLLPSKDHPRTIARLWIGIYLHISTGTLTGSCHPPPSV